MKMESQIRLVNIDDIIPNRFQPRLHFKEDALNDLANSIKEHGIIEPLVLRRVGNKFEIIAGERRYKASQLVGLTQVPAIIAALDDNESAEVAIIENTHRTNLSAIEEAKAYKKLLDRRYVTQDQLAKRLGTSQSTIANKIRLLSLADEIQNALLKEQISERHARSLLKINDKQKQIQFLNNIINERWTVKRLDDEIDSYIGNYKESKQLGTGGINNNKYDLNINDVINNSVDIKTSNVNVGGYSNEIQSPRKNKKSILFNQLEDESVNMNLGFNPFQTNNINIPSVDEDMDILDLDEEDSSTAEEVVKKVKIEEIEYETEKEVEEAINKILNQAKKNKLNIDIETFTFDEMNQLIIRFKK